MSVPMAAGNVSSTDCLEVEVSNEFEACCSLQEKKCKKDPTHSTFIPVNDFTIDHLPEGYKDEDIFKIVKEFAALTVNVTVTAVSPSRPEFFPKSTDPYPFHDRIGHDQVNIDGTGRIVNVEMRTEQTCPCHKCRCLEKVTKKWGEIWIITSTHVVFDDFEARHATCGLFFDLPTGPRVKIEGGWADENLSVVKSDWSIFKCASCDVQLLDLLKESIDYCHGLCETVRKRYEKTQDVDKLAVIVSHPHGCSAHVTVGHWIERRVTLTVKPDNSEEVCEATSYTYTNSTCPGSSGAYVYKLGRGGWSPIHPHMGCSVEGVNLSGEALETV